MPNSEVVRTFTTGIKRWHTCHPEDLGPGVAAGLIAPLVNVSGHEKERAPASHSPGSRRTVAHVPRTAKYAVMIDGNTLVLAIVGDPLSQARTPALVNAALVEHGRNAVLVPLLVSTSALADVVTGLRGVRNFAGAVVTMPHKEAIMPLLDWASPPAARAGACNVIRREPDGRLAGSAFDGQAVIGSLLSDGFSLEGRDVLLAGAGGAARAIACALAEQGISRITIQNRTHSRAVDLAALLRTVNTGLDVQTTAELLAPTDTQIAINATSLGMGAVDPPPFMLSQLTASTVIVDMVMRTDTPLVTAARARGSRCLTGENILSTQVGLLIDYMLGDG